MSLTVEAGTGDPNADSYISLTDATTYLANYGDDNAAWLIASPTAQEAGIREATRYIDAEFALRWNGTRANQLQALAWPRYNATDYDDFAVGYNSVPSQVKAATAILAAKAVSVDLLPDVAAGSGPLKSKEVHAGPVGKSVTFMGAAMPTTTYSLINALLAPLISSGLVMERG